jgi:hypothetical protein
MNETKTIQGANMSAQTSAQTSTTSTTGTTGTTGAGNTLGTTTSRDKFISLLADLAYKFLRSGFMVENVTEIIETILEIMVTEFKPIIDPVERGRVINEAVTRAVDKFTDEFTR